MLPRISVVTPSFNTAAFLESTIRSVLDQGYPNLQYVVIDGGSTDGSVDIIRRYEDRLAYWVSEPDGGHAAALNKGFAQTDGEIMAWLNSSDEYFEWTLETVASVFQDVAETSWMTGTPSRFEFGMAPQHIGGACPNKYDFLAGQKRWIQQESVFWRRSLWEAAGARLDEEFSLACDLDLWLRFFGCAELYQTETILARFRYHPQQRGVASREGYESEADRCFSVLRESAGTSELLKARLVAMTSGRLGRHVRLALRGAGLCPWDVVRKITYDFEEHRWRAT